MKVVRELSLQEHSWLLAPPLRKLLQILNSDGTTARCVGGCVRDTLLGRKIMDIDLACSLTPEISMQRLERERIKVIPTGLKHGTLTALIEDYRFEITTLRQDVETYGRHAKVAFTDNWVEDAKRRDFTINALYLDGDGRLYDPCGGLTDLEAGRVRFIGDADKRIQEDALRILRFFRFAAQFGKGPLDGQGLEACIRNKDMIPRLSGERLAAELFKILAAENMLPIISVLHRNGILDKILPGHQGPGLLEKFVNLEEFLGRCDKLARLSCLLKSEKDAVTSESRHLRLSNQQQATLCDYALVKLEITQDISRQDLRRYIYTVSRRQVIFALLRHWSGIRGQGGDDVYGPLFNYVESWPLPTFPLLGRDLMRAGIKSGPKMGAILKKMETMWVESDFSLDKQALLSHALSGLPAG